MNLKEKEFVKESRKGSKEKVFDRRKAPIERYNKWGYLSEITNPHGKKGEVRISQEAHKKGFTARTPKGRLVRSGVNAEKLGRSLAKQGYSKIRIMD